MTHDPREGLEPCPFCGGKAEITRMGDASRSTIYNCTECGCRLETGEEFSNGRRWDSDDCPDAGGGVLVDRAKLTEWADDFEAAAYEVPRGIKASVLLTRAQEVRAALSNPPAAAESKASVEAIIAEIDTYSRVHGVLEDDDRERMAKLKGQIAVLARQGNASVEARLREALATVEDLIRRDPACFNLSDELQSVRSAILAALSAGGDKAKK